jgi:hypothetical protein
VKDFTVWENAIQESERHTGNYGGDEKTDNSGHWTRKIAVPYISKTAAN